LKTFLILVAWPAARRKRARETVACDPSRFIDKLGDDVRQPEKPTSADAKANDSAHLAR
jgi:ATP-dependent DNA helicase Rep